MTGTEQALRPPRCLRCGNRRVIYEADARDLAADRYKVLPCPDCTMFEPEPAVPDGD